MCLMSYHPARACFCKFSLTSVCIRHTPFNISFFTFQRNVAPKMLPEKPVPHEAQTGHMPTVLRNGLYCTLKSTVLGRDMGYMTAQYGPYQRSKEALLQAHGEYVETQRCAKRCASEVYVNVRILRYSAQKCCLPDITRISRCFHDEYLTYLSLFSVFLYIQTSCQAILSFVSLLQHRPLYGQSLWGSANNYDRC